MHLVHLVALVSLEALPKSVRKEISPRKSVMESVIDIHEKDSRLYVFQVENPEDSVIHQWEPGTHGIIYLSSITVPCNEISNALVSIYSSVSEAIQLVSSDVSFKVIDIANTMTKVLMKLESEGKLDNHHRDDDDNDGDIPDVLKGAIKIDSKDVPPELTKVILDFLRHKGKLIAK